VQDRACRPFDAPLSPHGKQRHRPEWHSELDARVCARRGADVRHASMMLSTRQCL
jgi:hypothetical protein